MRLALPSFATLAASFAAAMLFALPAAASPIAPSAAPASKPAASAPAPRAPAAKLSDRKLGQAATAMVHVISLRKSYEEKLDKAAPQDKPRVEDEGERALKKAVTDQGLSVEEYNSIIAAANKDPALRQKLLAHVAAQR